MEAYPWFLAIVNQMTTRSGRAIVFYSHTSKFLCKSLILNIGLPNMCHLAYEKILASMEETESRKLKAANNVTKTP